MSEPPGDPDEFAEAVGEGIRRGRQALGWTQVELAEASALSPNYVARLERGELGPSLFVAHRIAEALGISLEALIGTSPAKTTKRKKSL